MSSSPPLRAALLDPAPIWLDAVEFVLQNAGVEVVGKTTFGSDVARLVADLRPDLLVLELDPLPGEPDGLEVLRRARSLAPPLRAIVLTGHDDTVHIDAALAAGAAAYVLKTAHPADVASAVREAFGRAAPRRSNPGGLTRRELQILKLVANGQPNATVARKLWVTEQTVKFHLSNIYRKLGVANRTEAGRWAALNGVFAEDDVTRV